MDFAVPLETVSPHQVRSEWCVNDSAHNLFYLIVLLFFWSTEDSKFSNEAAKGRSANENESTLRDIVEATRSRFSSMLSQEFLTATVTTDQPEFMHNLAFQ